MTPSHGLHVYRTEANLTARVAAFARTALLRGEAAVLVPARAHREPLLARLDETGVDVGSATAAGRLVLADADELAARTVARGAIDEVWGHLTEVITGGRARGLARLSIWGETPDVLLKAGKVELFEALERRWCAATEEDPAVDLLCSCRGDLLDPAFYEGELQRACALHSHAWELEDAEALHHLVDAAASSILGPRMTSMAWCVADVQPRPTRALPLPLARLLWLRTEMPSTWARVLKAAAEARAAG